MQRNLLGACVLVPLLIATGCGGSTPLSRAQFTRRANAVCTHAVNELRRRPSISAAGLPERYVVYHTAKADGIGALKPPKALQAGYDQYMRAVTSTRELFQKMVTATRAKTATTPIGTQLQPALRHEEELAAALGINSCVEVQFRAHRH